MLVLVVEQGLAVVVEPPEVEKPALVETELGECQQVQVTALYPLRRKRVSTDQEVLWYNLEGNGDNNKIVRVSSNARSARGKAFFLFLTVNEVTYQC